MRPCCFAGPVPPEGTARGRTEALGGVPCYVADDQNAISDSDTPVLVMAPDVFGPVNLGLCGIGF